MRIVFMGTPSFAVPSLRMLVEKGHEILAVISQPDRPKGRKKVLTPSPVKEAAVELGLQVLQPERMRSEEAVEEIARLHPDIIVTAAYGQILPKAVLDLPKLGCINVHGSLLPKYRGGAPIQRCIINGEKETGVTIMYMAEGLDTGDMISKVVVPIEEEDTSGTLFDKLSLAGAKLLEETLLVIERGEVQAERQNDSEATYAPNLTREDERIDWSKSAIAIFNQVRGLSPMAGAFTYWDGAVFKLWKCTAVAGQTEHIPGTIVRVGDAGIEIQTGEGLLRVEQVQPAGKKVMDAVQWLQGSRAEAGSVFQAGESL